MESLLIKLKMVSVTNLSISKLRVQRKKSKNYQELFTRVNMSGYVIANIDVKNHEAYKEYVGKVVPTVQKFGGEYLVRAGEYKVIDGEWKYPRTVVIKFPTYEKALEWYDSEEYKPVKPIRLANSVANGIIIKGV